MNLSRRVRTLLLALAVVAASMVGVAPLSVAAATSPPECRYDDVLTLTTKFTRISFAKLDHAYELRRDGQLLTTGDTTLACIDREGKVQRMTDLFPECFEDRTA